LVFLGFLHFFRAETDQAFHQHTHSPVENHSTKPGTVMQDEVVNMRGSPGHSGLEITLLIDAASSPCARAHKRPEMPFASPIFVFHTFCGYLRPARARRSVSPDSSGQWSYSVLVSFKVYLSCILFENIG
jgi:hypothetical protein